VVTINTNCLTFCCSNYSCEFHESGPNQFSRKSLILMVQEQPFDTSSLGKRTYHCKISCPIELNIGHGTEESAVEVNLTLDPLGLKLIIPFCLYSIFTYFMWFSQWTVITSLKRTVIRGEGKILKFFNSGSLSVLNCAILLWSLKEMWRHLHNWMPVYRLQSTYCATMLIRGDVKIFIYLDAGL